MKKLFFVLSFLVATSSQANTTKTVFKSDSVLPKALQSQVLEYVVTHCGDYVSDFGLNETKTSFWAKDFDNGNVFYSYTIELTSNYYPDGYHPDLATIVVSASQTVSMNGETKTRLGDVIVNGSRCN